MKTRIFISASVFLSTIFLPVYSVAEAPVPTDNAVTDTPSDEEMYTGIEVSTEESPTEEPLLKPETDSEPAPEENPPGEAPPAAAAAEESRYIGIILPGEPEMSAGAATTGPTAPQTPPGKKSAPSEKAEPVYRQPALQDKPAEAKEVLPWFTVAPEVGYVFFPKSRMEVNGFKATVEARNGLTFKLHFDLGGDGLAFELAPIFTVESGGITTDAGGFGNLSSIDLSSGGSFQAVGGEFAVVYRFRVKRFFPHIGIGFHGAYLMGDRIDYGAELYGRLPVGFTVYFAKKAAFIFDLGFMFGVTGIRTPLKLPALLDTMPADLRTGLEGAETQADFTAWYEDNQAEVDVWLADPNNGLPEGYSSTQLAADIAKDQLGTSIRFGQGFGLDISIGIRFP